MDEKIEGNRELDKIEMISARIDKIEQKLDELTSMAARWKKCIYDKTSVEAINYKLDKILRRIFPRP